jgi:hypothetical protein
MGLIYYSRQVLLENDKENVIQQKWVWAYSISMGTFMYVGCMRIVAFFMMYFMQAE